MDRDIELDLRILDKVGKALIRIAAYPSYRKKPLGHDLRGDFDRWFGGGAVKYITGRTEWTFADGTKAAKIVTPGACLSISIPGQPIICVSAMAPRNKSPELTSEDGNEETRPY